MSFTAPCHKQQQLHRECSCDLQDTKLDGEAMPSILPLAQSQPDASSLLKQALHLLVAKVKDFQGGTCPSPTDLTATVLSSDEVTKLYEQPVRHISPVAFLPTPPPESPGIHRTTVDSTVGRQLSPLRLCC